MRPNIVFMIVDNQSPWTLGCHGNQEILTPNIDRLAGQGIRFNNAMCVNPVCSPNRATCLTGLMPSQHGVHNWLGLEQPDAQMGPDAYCTIKEFATLPQILADEGLTCGLSGKWHLGDSLHPQLGFGYWFGKPRGHTDWFRNAEAIWQGEVYKEPRYSIEAIADHAVDFLQQTRNDPFFLYVGFNGPYGLDPEMRAGHQNRHTAYYADKELRCFPRGEVHPWLVQYRDCVGNPTAMRSYAAAVSGVDDGVGTIMQSLDELGLAENTLVIFTADHGLCTGHNGYWGMSDHGRPLMMYDGNLRIPLIMRHPGHIAAGSTYDTATCHYDLFPSLLDYMGLQGHRPTNLPLPGRSYAPALAGKPVDWGQEVTFHEYENTRTIRTPQWKLTRRHPDGPHDLYDLRNDPGEKQNLIDQPRHAAIQRDLDAQLRAFFERYSQPQFDLWKGGRAKAARIM